MGVESIVDVDDESNEIIQPIDNFDEFLFSFFLSATIMKFVLIPHIFSVKNVEYLYRFLISWKDFVEIEWKFIETKWVIYRKNIEFLNNFYWFF